jgi:hypothetical protein
MLPDRGAGGIDQDIGVDEVPYYLNLCGEALIKARFNF